MPPHENEASPRTTPRVRAELQAAKAPTHVLAARYGLNHKTVGKWRRWVGTDNAPMGPRQPRSSTRSEAEEKIIVEFRRRILLPLDDALGCLRETIPTLSRSPLHRCLARHCISRLGAHSSNIFTTDHMRSFADDPDYALQRACGVVLRQGEGA